MKKHTHVERELKDVKQLLDFKIYNTNFMEDHGSIAVFANGLQQCWIVVQFIAADADGNHISLSDADVESALSLVRYNDGKPLPSAYSYTFDKNTFDWVETEIPGKRPQPGKASKNIEAHPDETQTKTIYLSVSSGGANELVGACFKVNSSLMFWTGRPADERQPRDGQFDSSVQVHAVPSPKRSEIDFGAGANGALFETTVGDQNKYTYRASEYYLDPKFNGGALPLDAVQGDAFVGGVSTGVAFGIYTHGKFDSPVQWGISYYADPTKGELVAASLPKAPLAFVGGTDPDVMFTNCASAEIVGASPNRVVIGMLKGKTAELFTNSSGLKVNDVQSSTIYIQDRYGNSYSGTLSYNASTDEVTFR